MTTRRSGGVGVDQETVIRVREAVNASFVEQRTPDMGMADQRQLTQALIQAEVGTEARRRAESGVPALNAAAEHALSQAVDNAINGIGKLQNLLDIEGVEDIYIHGAEPVRLRMADGRMLEDEPIADTPDELFAQVQFLAAHHGSRERPFSPANPVLDMALPDGSRLAAVCDLSPWPIVTIRRMAFRDVTLDSLLTPMGSITPAMMRFLKALVTANQVIVVSGAPFSGKTVLLRALTREIDHYVRYATLETEYELGLHRDGNASPLLVPLEGRQGSMERDPAGRPMGEITLADLLPPVLRHSITRVIYGEVRGPEAYAFLKGANAGLPGSMTTIHANSAEQAMDRLVTAAMEGAPGMSAEYLTRLAAQGVNYVVHVRRLDHTAIGGSAGRFVAEIGELTGQVSPAGKPAMNWVFRPAPGSGDPRGVFEGPPERVEPFQEIGFDLSTLNRDDAWDNTFQLGRLA